MRTYLLIFLFVTAYTDCNNTDLTCQEGHFSCLKINNNSMRCCGIRANGREFCSTGPLEQNGRKRADWVKKDGGKWAYCSNNTNTDMDLCCDSGLVEDCSVCSAFVILPYTQQTNDKNNGGITTFVEAWENDPDKLRCQEGQNCNNPGDNGTGVTLSDQWQIKLEDFDERDANNNLYNKIFPVGFIPATLKEFSDPPVCVYVPNSSGKMIEIKAEPEESGNRLCVSDLSDDVLGRNEAGQGTPCDETRLTTCLADASDDKDFTFYVFCNNEGCAEGYDVLFWLRARVSEESWKDGHETADKNVEMWCQYVLDEYPEWDRYPFDLEPYKPPPSQPITGNNSATVSVLLSFVFFWLML